MGHGTATQVVCPPLWTMIEAANPARLSVPLMGNEGTAGAAGKLPTYESKGRGVWIEHPDTICTGFAPLQISRDWVFQPARSNNAAH